MPRNQVEEDRALAQQLAEPRRGRSADGDLPPPIEKYTPAAASKTSANRPRSSSTKGGKRSKSATRRNTSGKAQNHVRFDNSASQRSKRNLSPEEDGEERLKRLRRGQVASEDAVAAVNKHHSLVEGLEKLAMRDRDLITKELERQERLDLAAQNKVRGEATEKVYDDALLTENGQINLAAVFDSEEMCRRHPEMHMDYIQHIEKQRTKPRKVWMRRKLEEYANVLKEPMEGSVDECFVEED